MAMRAAQSKRGPQWAATVLRLHAATARGFLERARFAALVLGCASLFWQWDLAIVDVFFGLGIVLSLVLWERGAPLFDLIWPQPLLLLFLTITAVVTTVENGSSRFFVITAYLAMTALALTSALRRDVRRTQTIEGAMVLAGAITAVTVTLGAFARQLGVPFFELFAYDYLRGEGLFKDPNVAGAFVACTYPLAAVRSLRLGRWRVPLLLVATAVFTAGVFLSYSRWALVLLVLGLVGTAVRLAFARDWRPLAALVVIGLGAGLVGHQALPSFRYQAVQSYDEHGRLVAWRLGLELMLTRPLGTGAGSFEAIAVEQNMRSDAASAETATPEPAPATGTPVTNLVTNGAFDGTAGWRLGTYATTIDDPTSPTGHALRKETSLPYQDPGIYVPVEGGATYSFGAAIKSDGTPALLIVHWRDANDVTIDQVASELVTATSWTETQLTQVAPLEARSAVLLLSNLEPGIQYFAAVRAVAGPTLPAWSAGLQRVEPAGTVAVPSEHEQGCRTTASCSTHNTFIRLIVESGIPGFLAIAAYFGLLLSSLIRMGRRSDWTIALILVVVAGLTIDTLHWRQLWIYIGVAAAHFTASPARLGRPREPVPVRAANADG